MDSVIAKLKKSGNIFEILVYPRESLEFRQGKLDIQSTLVTDEIFSDVAKGERVPTDILKKYFGTSEKIKVAEIILSDGELQLPKELRDDLLEKKKRKIATIISKTVINPQTKAPHPIERILNAMNTVGVIIDLYKKPEEQVNTVIEKLREQLPISIEYSKLRVNIPAKYSNSVYSILKSLGKISSEIWRDDGSFSCILEIPTAQKSEIYSKLSSVTHGEIVISE
ncbi:MAG: ribosome assembly factor SBDS [Candidatus Aenigmarchaeota archaeon ex4484_56]|nr:MAG: ribosome assembly factor SBDS [Candidatus Aenigmarchaeota archaeon ex4484_56]